MCKKRWIIQIRDSRICLDRIVRFSFGFSQTLSGTHFVRSVSCFNIPSFLGDQIIQTEGIFNVADVHLCTDSLQWWFHLLIDGTSKRYITYSKAEGKNPSKMSTLFKPSQTQLTTIDLNSTILFRLSVNKCIHFKHVTNIIICHLPLSKER